jgi:MoaA/NifB/PqqE/SkfB family radical SAM enzyme
MRVVDIIIAARPGRVLFGGGEPLLVSWWDEASRRIVDAGIAVTLFTGAWIMTTELAERAADSVTGVAVSIDGATAQVHDHIRGRKGSFDRAVSAVDQLSRVKEARLARAARIYRLGLDYTVTRTGWYETTKFVAEMTARFPGVDYITFGAVIPEGLAQEVAFVETELLSDDQLAELSDMEPLLASLARSDATISVTDARRFLPHGPLGDEAEGVAHIEASGHFRASTNFEAKVGNVLDEPLDVLWQRALAWRDDPFVVEQQNSINSLADWARVTRIIDRRYGSAEDIARISRRGASNLIHRGACEPLETDAAAE